MLATVIGALAIAIPIIAAAGERPTSRDTVDGVTQQSSRHGEGLVPADAARPSETEQPMAATWISAEGRLSPSFLYTVPVDSPWAELWVTPGACAAETFEWLESHGDPVRPNELTSTITNSATTGSDAVISDIRAEGTLSAPPVDTVVVGGTACIGGVDEGVFARMELGIDSVALFDGCYGGEGGYSCAGAAEELPEPGDPVFFSVAPGATQMLHLIWTQTMDFVGRFIATVTVDGVTSTIDLSPDGEDLVVPTVTRPDTVLYFDDDGPWCESNASPRIDSCALDAWRAILAAG